MLFLTLLLFDTLIIQLVRQTISISTPFVDRDVSILFSGLPGLMAVETANLCSSQGLHILPFGFTGQRTTERETHIHGYDGKIINIHLYKELSVPAEGLRLLRDIKSKHQNLIIVDYTSPKSALNNLRTYIAAECDFVMGTTGLDYEQIHQEFENAKNYALIAPNMAKQIVAIQMTLSDMALKVPGVFANYDLTVREPHVANGIFYSYVFVSKI